jgi:hypothetical protein
MGEPEGRLHGRLSSLLAVGVAHHHFWAAHYLLGRHFRSGAYHVGGPIGLVRYYREHQELRLGPPLVIAKKISRSTRTSSSAAPSRGSVQAEAHWSNPEGQA